LGTDAAGDFPDSRSGVDNLSVPRIDYEEFIPCGENGEV
jgi:hypothetical protein